MLVAEGTADCAEPMEKAGRGGTKFSLANDKTVFAGGALAFARGRGLEQPGVGAFSIPVPRTSTPESTWLSFSFLVPPSLTSTPGFLDLLARALCPLLAEDIRGLRKY